MRLTIRHRTLYRYDAPPPYGLKQVRLRPANGPGQRVLAWAVEVEGGRTEAEFLDQHANHVALVNLEPERREVVVTCAGEIETSDVGGVFGRHQALAPLWLFSRATPLTAPGPHIAALAADVPAGADDVGRLHALAQRVAEAMRYDIGRTDVGTPAEAALAAGHGVCQDHAHVFVSAARLLGFPARYVSGYLWLSDRDDQEAGHAWAEAHVAYLGWVGFDVSNGISPDERYVRVATGLDYAEAAPISGIVLGPGQGELSVAVHVQQQ
jgi:transglutaminase-like putative cysteine protease